MTTEFTQLGLLSQFEQTLIELGYETPTPIQSAIIPVMLTNQDVIGQAQTGTGKTAAFSLPILQNLIPNQNYVQCLVLTPTRELAIQVADAMYQYGKHLAVHVLPVYGGQPYSRQINRLRKGVDIVVGTPGRLLDLIEKKELHLNTVSTVVIDEADEMLSMGFIDDIESILAQTPTSRQTALFSATMPQAIRHLADSYMHHPQFFTINPSQLTVAAVEQRCYLVNEEDKLAALTRLFEVEPITSALIFTRTRTGTGDLANALTVRGFPAEALNGDLNQEARERVMNRFRNNQITVLVATDVAARGLDIDDISHVFNFDLPQDPENYVHRIGRTGRAGKTGIAISLLTPKEQWNLGRIESYTKQKINRHPLPTVEDIQTYRETQLLNQVTVWLKRGRCQKERDLANRLMEQGYELMEIAAAALKLTRAEEKQRPIAPIGEVQEWHPQKSRGTRRGKSDLSRDFSTTSHEQGMVRLTLNTGRTSGVKANHVVNALARYAEIPGSSIGKISIADRHTLVDVPEKFAGQVLARTGSYRIGRQAITVERA